VRRRQVRRGKSREERFAFTMTTTALHGRCGRQVERGRRKEREGSLNPGVWTDARLHERGALRACALGPGCGQGRTVSKREGLCTCNMSGVLFFAHSLAPLRAGVKRRKSRPNTHRARHHAAVRGRHGRLDVIRGGGGQLGVHFSQRRSCGSGWGGGTRRSKLPVQKNKRRSLRVFD